jgi:hypothetical protein
MPVQLDTTANAALAFVALDFFDAALDRYSVQLTLFVRQGAATVELGEQSGFVDGGSSYIAHSVPDPLPMGQWTDVKMTIVRSNGTTEGTLSFGKTTETATPLTMSVTPNDFQVVIGSGYETVPSQGWTLRYDNVVVTSF